MIADTLANNAAVCRSQIGIFKGANTNDDAFIMKKMPNNSCAEYQLCFTHVTHLAIVNKKQVG